MRVPRALRWGLVPIAAVAGLVGGLALVTTGGWLLRLGFSEADVAAAVPLDWRVGVLGAVAAGGVVVLGSEMAPSARRLTSVVLLGLGAWVAVLLLGSWSFPESHPLAYRPSSVPLRLTIAGGIVGTAVEWWRHRGAPGSS